MDEPCTAEMSWTRLNLYRGKGRGGGGGWVGGCVCVCVCCVCVSWPYRDDLFLTCLSFFLVEALPQLADALVHQRHLDVALVEQLLLLLQLAVLLLVQLVADLQQPTIYLTL